MTVKVAVMNGIVLATIVLQCNAIVKLEQTKMFVMVRIHAILRIKHATAYQGVLISAMNGIVLVVKKETTVALANIFGIILSVITQKAVILMQVINNFWFTNDKLIAKYFRIFLNSRDLSRSEKHKNKGFELA